MKILLKYCLLLQLIGFSAFAQETNNLIHEANYVTSEWGEVGEVKEFGSGEKTMILLPGWGFDWTIFEGFIAAYEDKFKIYAITIPGFGSTTAPAMPENNDNYSDTQWTNGILKGITNLMDEKGIEKATIVSYFTYSNLIATRLALDLPERIENVIIISGMAKFTSNYVPYEPSSLQQRIYYIEKSLAPQWFKTVSKETWDSGNFHPEVFTKDSIAAKKYWNQMSAVPIPTMVRYLCEFYCTDLSLEYENLKVPVLVVMPSFTNEVLYDPKTSYAASFFHYSWLGAKPASQNIAIVAVTDSNAFIVDDQPKKLFQIVNEFLAGKLNRFQVVR
ncbi:alpha/beta fold hydrolase [Ekhidna sp. To15]|uniref:alpha/beta fold hydrolase n=1 Tax=Ekhidna sp. To15 TaxID=3395267 RepID=UPI003F527BB1